MTSELSRSGNGRMPRGQPDGAGAVERPGDPACWLRRICPTCGSVADEDPPTVCPACRAEIPGD